MGETTSWTEKAAEISKQATWISNYVQSHGLPIPSFSLDEPQDFLITDEAIQNARSALIDACRELLEAAIGPTALLKFEIPKVRMLLTFQNSSSQDRPSNSTVPWLL